jgi:hypothetical protein
VNELGTVEEIQEDEIVLRDVALFDPVGDAAHTGAEVPAVDDKGHSEIQGQTDALLRRVPPESEGHFGWVGQKETIRVGVQLQVRIELVEAKPLQMMVIRHDIEAIAAGTRAVLCE